MMRGVRSADPVVVALAAVCLALATLLIAQVREFGAGAKPDRDPGPPPTDAPPAEPRTAPDESPPTLTAFSEVIRRPLFVPERRPAENDAPVQVDAATGTRIAGEWKVAGIVITGEDTFALLRNRRTDKVIRLRPGMQLDGWKTVDITSRQVSLSMGNQRVTIPLRENKGGDDPSAVNGRGIWKPN